MRAVIQRVSHAACRVNGKVTGEIQIGLLVLLGIADDDDHDDLDWLAQKIVNMRIFIDENHLMNKALTDVNGNILLIKTFSKVQHTRNKALAAGSSLCFGHSIRRMQINRL